MLLPSNPKALKDAVMEQLYYCTRSMVARAAAYSRRESVYRKGSSGVIRGRLNKAGPAIDKQAALLFAPHLIKFWGQVPPEENNEDVFEQVESVSDAVKLAWNDLDLDVLFPMAVKWGLVDGCRILSLIPQVRTDWEVELRCDLIHPRDFGVGREVGTGSFNLERQQAVCVRSYHTLEELDRWVQRRPDKATILDRCSFVSIDSGERGSRITGMAPGATTLQARPENWPSVSGSGDDVQGRIVAEFYELRLFDDDLNDWRVFTVSGDVILRDRPGSAVGVPQMLPYVKVAPDEDPEIFWGSSLIETLSPLQEWYLNRMEGMDEKFRQSLRPPTAAIGLGQSFEEKIAAFRRPGGRIAIPNQNASIKQFRPELSESDYTMMATIAEQLNDQAQLRPGMFGKGEPGVRGEGMQNSLMKLASAEILIKSLLVEGQAQTFSNLLFQSLRRYSTAKLIDSRGKLFALADFPGDIKMMVDGHSSSPIAVEDHKTEAKGLFQMGLITPTRAIRMIAPVMESGMLHDMSRIEDAKMIAAEKIKLEQQEKRGGKESAGTKG